MKKFLAMPLSSRVTIVLGTFIVVLVIFWAGMVAGYEKAEYSFRWGNHYADNFGGPRSPFGMMMPMNRDGVNNANGAAGIVVAVNLPTVAVKGPNEAEKIILISSTTMIRVFHDQGKANDIHVGDMLVAIGTPNVQGQIAASFVRLMASSTLPMMRPR